MIVKYKKVDNKKSKCFKMINIMYKSMKYKIVDVKSVE